MRPLVVLLSTITLGVSLGGAAGAATRVPHSGDPEWRLLVDLVRAGRLAPTWTRGDRDTDELCGALLGLDDPRAGALRRWMHCGEPTPPGGAAGVDVLAVAQTTDPTTRLAPTFLDLSDDADPTVRLQTRVHSSLRFTGTLHGRFVFRFDSEGKNDPHNRTREFSQLGVSNNIDEATLRWAGSRGALWVGRAPLALGPSRGGSLVLSELAPALDQVRGELRWGPHLLRALVAQLSSTTDAEDRPVRRYLYVHRADLELGPVRLGVTELAVVSGRNESLSLRYLNPLQFYAQAQVERDGDTGTQVNVINAVDAETTWRGLHLYGSLAVDDLQIDAAGRDRYPHQLATALGADLRWRTTLSSYEWRRVGSWTYLHRGEGTTWQHYGVPLGAPEGPDTDRHLGQVQFWPRSHLTATLRVERWRRGENRVWTTEDRAGHSGEPFPRGRVEKRWVLGGALAWDAPPWARVHAELGWHAIRNLNNTTRDDEVLELRLLLELRSPRAQWRVGD